MHGGGETFKRLSRSPVNEMGIRTNFDPDKNLSTKLFTPATIGFYKKRKRLLLASETLFDVAAVHVLGHVKPVLKTGLVQHPLWLADERTYAMIAKYLRSRARA